MTNTNCAGKRIGFQPLFKITKFAFRTSAIKFAAHKCGNTSGIIAAVLEPFERINQQRRNITAADNPDYSTHKG